MVQLFNNILTNLTLQDYFITNNECQLVYN